MFRYLSFLILAFSSSVTSGQDLTNATNLSITKSWEQEPNGYTYDVANFVPEGATPEGGFPVCILLHGFGGNGQMMLNDFSNKLDCHIIVAPTGYQNCWNISGEPSDGPDVEVVGDLIDMLQGFQNVNPEAIRIAGFSNGSALSNRLLIENNNPGVESIIAVISHLSEPQFHNGSFHGPSGATDGSLPFFGYDTPLTPAQGRRYLSISNTNDNLIPYEGGASGVGVDFLDAEQAVYNIALSQGYSGDPLSDPSESIGGLALYSYLNGQVQHLKGNAGHSMSFDQEQHLIDFLNDCTSTTGLSENQPKKKPVRIMDLLGRDVEPNAGQLLLFLFDDHSVEKRMVTE